MYSRGGFQPPHLAPHVDLVNGVGDVRVKEKEKEKEKENTIKGEMKVVRGEVREVMLKNWPMPWEEI
jgi:hypothetical protein